jgi:hypothetical protein
MLTISHGRRTMGFWPFLGLVVMTFGFTYAIERLASRLHWSCPVSVDSLRFEFRGPGAIALVVK